MTEWTEWIKGNEQTTESMSELMNCNRISNCYNDAINTCDWTKRINDWTNKQTNNQINELMNSNGINGHYNTCDWTKIMN